MKRLAAALLKLEARVFTDNLPEGLTFNCSADTLQRAKLWNLVTTAGRLDIAFEPSGIASYQDLARISHKKIY